MTDIAAIGIKVDSTQAGSAAQVLDRLAASGKSAADAVGALVQPSAASAAALGRAGGAMREAGDASKAAKRDISGMAEAMREQRREMSTLEGLLKRYAYQIGVTFSVGRLLGAADEWGQLASRMQIATGSALAGADAMEKLLEVANRTYQPVGEVAELFIRTSESLREIGYSSEQTLGMVEALSYGLTVSAAQGQKASSVIDAWSKSILRGKMDMEAFNTVISYAPRLQQALATALNTTNAGLMQMVMAGELTAEKLLQVSTQTEIMGREADLMPVTIRDSFNRLSNSIAKWAGEMNEGLGVTRLLTGAMGLLADNVGAVIAALGTLVALKAASWIGALALGTRVAAGGFAALAVAARGAFMAMGPVGWAITALGTAATAWELFGSRSRSAGNDAEDASQRAGNATAAGVNRMRSDLDRLIEKYREVAEVRDQALTTSSFMAESAAGYEQNIARIRELGNALADSIRTGQGAAMLDGKYTSAVAIKAEMDSLVALMNTREETARKIQQRSLADLLADPKGMTEAEQRVAQVKAIRDRFDNAILGETDPQKIEAAKRARDRMIAEVMKPRGRTVNRENEGERFLQSLERQRDMMQALTVEEQVLADIQAGRLKLQGNVSAESVLRVAREIDAARAQKEADQALAQATIETMNEEIRLREDLVSAAQRETESLSHGNKTLADEIELIGKNAAARMAIEKARLSSAIAVKEESLALAEKSGHDQREIEALREQVRLLRERQGLLTQKGAAEALAEDAKAAEEFSRNAAENVQRYLGQGLYDIMDGNFKNIGRSFGDMIKRMVAEAMAADLAKALLGDLVKGGSGKGLLGTAFSAISGFFANADGGVYKSPSLSAYSGGVYDSPRLFAFAKGAGVFAEDGAEAIMPLKRGRDGKLGVQASGASNNVTVNVHVDSRVDRAEVQRSVQQGVSNALGMALESRQRYGAFARG